MMIRRTLPLALLITALFDGSALARSSIENDGFSGGGELPPYLQCVPYARDVSGINIYGDAHTWWDQAEGRYGRGSTPRVGAVMAFRPHGNMRLGHVAAISRVIDSRTVLLRHANWSEINGRRGQIEDDVRAIDVSDSNDWSEVRVWYAPSEALGSTHWPVHGFIYGSKSGAPRQAARLASASASPARGILASLPRQPGRPAARPASPAKSQYANDPIGEIIAASLSK